MTTSPSVHSHYLPIQCTTPLSSVHYKSMLYMSPCKFRVASTPSLLPGRLQRRLPLTRVRCVLRGHHVLRCVSQPSPQAIRRHSQTSVFQVSVLHVEVSNLLRLRVAQLHRVAVFMLVSITLIPCDYKCRVNMCLIRPTPDLFLVPLADDKSE